METYEKVEVFLSSALVRGEWSGSGPVRFTPGERSLGTQGTGGSMGMRSGRGPKEVFAYFKYLKIIIWNSSL